MKLRDYQQEAVDSVWQYLRENDGNPCVVSPTGSGKSILLAKIATDAVQKWGGRVLILAHVKELLEQNADKVRALCPDIPVGVYSAGLKSRDTDQSIIVAGIQSVYKRAGELDRFDLILIDECHLLAPDSESRYRSFLNDAKIVNPHVRLIGFTATPYRMKSGLICGPDNLLNEVCYEIGVKALIDQGYLCPLRTKAGRQKVDTSGLHIRAGEFIASEVDQLVNDESAVRSACREIVQLTADRNRVLIFAASVDHAEHVQKTIEKLSGEECGIVTGDTPAGQRADILARFKGERRPRMLFNDAKPLKYLVNVEVLTTGFDAPNIDTVVMLRPTASPGLYYQMVGRGIRLHESKSDCLVLDYGGNILRHGPVDAIEIKSKRSSGSGDAPAKECPECQGLIHAGLRECTQCGYEFPAPESNKHEETASTEGVLSGEIIDTDYEVQDVFYSVHTKRGADEDDPKTMRVDYQVSFNDLRSEWICIEHEGWARGKAEKWWKHRSHMVAPTSTQEAVNLANAGLLAKPHSITVRKVTGERFDRIIKYQLGDIPELPEPGAFEHGEAWSPIDVDAFGDYNGVPESDEIPF